MKFLADENSPGFAVRHLRGKGFRLGWVAEDQPGANDGAIAARCAAESLTLLTLDKDFGELVFRRGLPVECGVVLFRIELESPQEFTRIAEDALESFQDWTGNFVVVERSRIRFRPLPAG